MVGEVDYCRKCGTSVYPFSVKRAASDGLLYCTKCAEKADTEYLTRHSCSVCTKLLSASEVKFVMPSRVYGHKPVPQSERLVCVSCYQRVATRVRDRATFRHKVLQIRADIRKSMMGGAMLEPRYTATNE